MFEVKCSAHLQVYPASGTIKQWIPPVRLLHDIICIIILPLYSHSMYIPLYIQYIPLTVCATVRLVC